MPVNRTIRHSEPVYPYRTTWTAQCSHIWVLAYVYLCFVLSLLPHLYVLTLGHIKPQGARDGLAVIRAISKHRTPIPRARNYFEYQYYFVVDNN